MFAEDGTPQIPPAKLHRRADALDEQIRGLTRLSDALQHVADCPTDTHVDRPKFRRLMIFAPRTTQGTIERWHQTPKNKVLLENYYLPGDLEAQIGTFIAHYNNHRYHESLGNLTPADVYLGRATSIIKRREKIKKQTFERRRMAHRRHAA